MKSMQGYSSLGEQSKTSVVSTRRYEPSKTRSNMQVELKHGDDVVPVKREEEWTTSKKVVNHKTKQVETRVQRQIVMEDGKVIADSGPQITTRTKEDNKVEESENTAKKVNGDIKSSPGVGYMAVPQSADVVDEKSETRNVTREAKQECLQYHDESIKELSGFEVHKKALTAPNELICIENQENNEPPKGKLTHYSSKSRKMTDKEELKEVSKKNIDGNVTTETTRTYHREEVDDDEAPQSEGAPQVLPEASSKTTRKMEFLTDYGEDFDAEKRLAVEDTIDSHTNRWVENHFGSEPNEHSIETSKTTAGGNIINIEMTSSHRPPQKHYFSAKKPENRSKSVVYVGDQKRSTPLMNTNIEKLSGKSETYKYSNRSEPLRYRSTSKRVIKEDASVQASLSDDSSQEEVSDEEHLLYTQRDKNNNTTVRTFYFGDEKDTTFRSNKAFKDSERNVEQFSNSGISGFPSFDRKDESSRDNLRLSSSERFKEYDTSVSHFDNFGDSFQRLSVSPIHEDKKIEGSRYYEHPIKIENPATKRDAKSRQRIEDSRATPPPIPSRKTRSPVQQLSKAGERDEYLTNYGSQSPTRGQGTWTKNKGRNIAPILRSSSPNFGNWPEFSPLTSPSELRHMSTAFEEVSGEQSMSPKKWRYNY